MSHEAKVVALICLASAIVTALCLWALFSWVNSYIAPQATPTSQLPTL